MPGFAKLARVLKAPEKDDEGDHRVRNLAVAGAGALPILGLIGDGPLRHHGEGAAFEDWAKFKRTLKPGDVLVSGESGLTKNKALISLATGTPRGYHISVVGHGGKLHQNTPYGTFETTALDSMAPEAIDFQHVQAVRPEMTSSQRAKFLATLIEEDKYNKKLKGEFTRKLFQVRRQGGDDALAKELAQLSPAEIKQMVGTLSGAGYDERKGVLAGIKHLLLPKLRTESSIAAAAREFAEGRKAPDASVGATSDRLVEGTRGLSRGRGGLRREFADDALRACMPSSRRGVCSTVPAQALHEATGRGVVSGKSVQDVLPADWLRSPNVTPVSRFTRQPSIPNRIADTALRAGPVAGRALLGLGLAGGTYGAARLMEHLRKDSDS